LAKINNRERVSSSLSQNQPLVSVLIPTYNSVFTIAACINSVKAQTYQNVEIIVIDNHSTDGTRAVAESLGAKTLIKGPERSAQMNYGAQCASGIYLLRVDSDMILDTDLIQKCLSLCFDGAQAVIIPVLPHLHGPQNFWVSCRMLEQKMLIDDMVNVAPRFIFKQIFLAVNGYDERIVAWEDYDLHNRLISSGVQTVSLKTSALWHLGEASSLSEIVRRMVKYGKTGSLGLFTKKHGSSGLKQISIFRPSFFRHKGYFFVDPSHFIGILLMKGVQSCSFVFGILIKKFD
jgi:glycosyltransferase involved in cell wall biosynthesis